MLRNFMVALGMSVLLAGCAPLVGVNANSTTPPSAETRKKFQGGTTNMTFSAHGTQVEFLSKDGRTALWYPGNGIVLQGRWRLVGADPTTGFQDNICFQYGANTYNPLTLNYGGNWECEGIALYQGHVVERVAGDPFGLDKRGAVPFVLPRQRTTFAELLKRRS
ncbi:hypothetical protein RNI52_34755 [Labrys neptuniae]|uniref:hypothetical protein n=1 Tax=Labrys neptuniae TaxID=376174 RepID=UPI0028915E36|nr:hypothetical protein [Labrys neptuniae]MDT3382538.1 hypothetical protein [Labrys neptuniae]